MSADAFAASIGRGASHKPTFPNAVRNGLVFGTIEAITPIVGWALGLTFAGFVAAIDHWIAFGLLALVGGKMAWEGFQPLPDEQDGDGGSRRGGAWLLIATAVGTSIDAAAVGVGLAFIGANIWIIAASIGFTTFVMTTIGMTIGRAVGSKFGKKVELLGGLVLIGLGASILIEHLHLLG
jgi:putative Mn2+ efflux pump MntP